MYRRIIVPLDGTPFGAYALPFAVSIARRTDAVLELVHVHTPRIIAGHPEDLSMAHLAGASMHDHDLDAEAARAEAVELRDKAMALAGAHGIPVVTRVLAGGVAPALEEESAAQDAGLVVMSTHGRGGVQRFRLGSVADELVRHSDRPVLLVRPPVGAEAPQPPAEPAFDHVLIALDGSAFAEGVLDPLGELLWSLGARVTLVKVVSPAEVAAAPPLDVMRPDAPGARATAQHYLEGVAARLGAIQVETAVRVVEAAEPAAGILKVAAEEGADLIAMATHGHGGLKRVLLGSTGDRVVRATDRPVLLYRPPGTAEEAPATRTSVEVGTMPPA